jgi:hypothetical protein
MAHTQALTCGRWHTRCLHATVSGNQHGQERASTALGGARSSAPPCISKMPAQAGLARRGLSVCPVTQLVSPPWHSLSCSKFAPRSAPSPSRKCQKGIQAIHAPPEQARRLQAEAPSESDDQAGTLRGSQPAEGNSETGPPADDFKWAQNWYPVAVEQDIDKRLPLGVTILGKAVVVWWDRNREVDRKKSGVWRAFLDLCPHRLAPLSEGL